MTFHVDLCNTECTVAKNANCHKVSEWPCALKTLELSFFPG